MRQSFRARRRLFSLAFALALVGGPASAQNQQGVPALPPPDGPVVLRTAAQPRIRVVPVTTGLSHPWGLAFRRNGDILVTERDKGTLRVIRNGQLDERAIPGGPEVYTGVQLAGLMDIAVHPDDDSLVYLTYSKPKERDGQRGATVALARGRLEGGALTEVRDIFVADGWGGGIAASRIVFGPDEKLYMTVGGAFQFSSTGQYAQDPGTHFGKLLRLNDDGTAPDDNPFVGNPDYLPEIYSMGHRNQLGLAFHPDTGDLWASENGPQGGDETNIIRAGDNYGWPLASYSREYSGVPVSETPWLEAFTGPEIIWWPSIAPSGLTFYTGEHFPAWQGNLFVGSMRVGRMLHTGHLERIVFNRQGQEIRREWLLTELKQRIRDVRQGPDGFLYVLTEEDDAVLLRIEPARAIMDVPGTIVPAHRLTAARVPPLPEAEWTDEQRALIEKYAPDGNPGNALRTLIRVPALADRVFPLLLHVANDSTLSPRHRAILILRSAWLAQNANLWATHASRAGEAGLTADEVLRVAQGPAEGWSEFEAVLVGLADELFRNSSVTDGTWDLLSEQYDLYNMVDAVITVNEITSQAILFNSLGIQPDDDTTARIPTTSVGYRVVVPDREPPLVDAAHRSDRRRRAPRDADASPPSGHGGEVERQRQFCAQPGAVTADPARPGAADSAHRVERAVRLRMGEARWQRRARAGSRSRAALDRAGCRRVGLERERAGAHRRGERDVSRHDHFRRDVARPVRALRHAPDDEHRRHRGEVSESVDDAQRVRCAAAPGRRAVSRARGLLTRRGRGMA